PFEEAHSQHLQGRKVQDVYTNIYHIQDTIFSNQTGRFSLRSQLGNKYIMVLMEIDNSAILIEPLKNRTDVKCTCAYSTVMLCLKQAGVTLHKHVLNNEISTAMKDLIKDTYRMTLKLVPPGCHHRNATEVAICNFKSHFLSILSGTADDFTLCLWDKLLPQAEIILNLLPQSNAIPTVSAYAHLNGPFDYNKMPLAPMGCNAQIHKKTDSCRTWAFHSIDGRYLNTSPEHYRTHCCHIKSTNSEHLSDIVHFQHKHITNPSLAPTNTLMAAIADCSRALKGLNLSNNNDGIKQLETLLQQASTQLNSTHTSTLLVALMRAPALQGWSNLLQGWKILTCTSFVPWHHPSQMYLPDRPCALLARLLTVGTTPLITPSQFTPMHQHNIPNLKQLHHLTGSSTSPQHAVACLMHSTALAGHPLEIYLPCTT
ncbi:hypothetical protein ACHAW6_006312, partial [Cyclotella cf. meneghiniana]